MLTNIWAFRSRQQLLRTLAKSPSPPPQALTPQRQRRGSSTSLSSLHSLEKGRKSVEAPATNTGTGTSAGGGGGGGGHQWERDGGKLWIGGRTADGKEQYYSLGVIR
ncbi:hypothetical protein YB2330_004066 [Saitoella coloradoensis]